MAFDNIHNYYEKLVLQHILDTTGRDKTDDFVEDVACVTLNQLPPRYVRYDVDMAFYLTAQEREAMETQIEKAVTHAIEYVSAHRKTAS